MARGGHRHTAQPLGRRSVCLEQVACQWHLLLRVVKLVLPKQRVSVRRTGTDPVVSSGGGGTVASPFDAIDENSQSQKRAAPSVPGVGIDAFSSTVHSYVRFAA